MAVLTISPFSSLHFPPLSTNTCDNNNHRRQYIQKLFHNAVLGALMPKIAGEQYDACIADINKLLGSIERKFAIALAYMRRAGKSDALQRLLATLLHRIRRFRALLVGPFIVQSQMNLEGGRKYMRQLPGGEESFKRSRPNNAHAMVLPNASSVATVGGGSEMSISIVVASLSFTYTIFIHHHSHPIHSNVYSIHFFPHVASGMRG